MTQILLWGVILAMASGSAWGMNSKTGDANAAKKNSWTVYEDSKVKFMHPETYQVSYHEFYGPNEPTWVLEPKSKKGLEIGEIWIVQRLDEKENRPLKQIFSETQNDRFKAIVGPNSVIIKDGECLSYITEGRALGLCGDTDSFFKTRTACIETTAVAECYRKNGNYLRIRSNLARYHDEGKPNAEHKKNAAVFDRVLKSLEFK